MDSKSKIFPWDIKRFGFGSPLKFGFFENRLFSWNERKWCWALFFCPNFMKFGGFEGFGLNFQPNLKKKFWGQKLPVFINYSCFYCLRKWPPAERRTKNFGTYYIPLERYWKVLSSGSGQSLDNLYGKLQIPVKVATFSRFSGFCWIQ